MEPSPKRARAEAPTDGETDVQYPYEREPDKYVRANDVLRLRFLSGAEEDKKSHRPEFTHQIWDDESIERPTGKEPFHIDLVYSASTLELFFELEGTPMTGPVEEALYKLADKMPPPCASIEQLHARASSAFSPAGVCGDKIGEYVLPSTGQIDVYCGALEDSEERQALARRLQSVMRFYIETFSYIDEDEARWNNVKQQWRLVTAYSQAGELVAGATVFRFNRWAGGSVALVVRICQVLVLPQHRGSGHGAALLQALYAYAKAEGAAEVTVEDPNPRFRFLRDLTDVRNCKSHALLVPEGIASVPTAEQLEGARSALLLTSHQMHRCYELQQHVMLQAAVSAAADDAEREEVRKQHRLSLKKRLNKRCEEEVGNATAAAEAEAAERLAGEGGTDEGKARRAKAAGIDAKKAKLEELFQETQAEYAAVAARLEAR